MRRRFLTATLSALMTLSLATTPVFAATVTESDTTSTSVEGTQTIDPEGKVDAAASDNSTSVVSESTTATDTPAAAESISTDDASTVDEAASTNDISAADESISTDDSSAANEAIAATSNETSTASETFTANEAASTDTIASESKDQIATATTYSVTDFGANGSDKADDTTAFQQALNQARNSTSMVTITVPSGTYRISSHLSIYSNTYLKLDENAKLLRTKESDYLFINGADDYKAENGGYTRSHDITIDGGVWDGNVSDTTISKGLAKIFHAKNVTIKNATFKNCCGTHFVLMSGVSGITVQNTTFSNFIEFTGTEESYTEQTGATFTYRGTEALHTDFIGETDISSAPADNTPCKDILVENCTFNKCTTGIGTHHVFDNMSADNVIIRNNTFTNCYFYCIDTASFSDFEAYGNTATNTGGFIYAERTDGSIHDNTITAKTSLSGSIYAHDNYGATDAENVTPFLNNIRISDKSNLEVSNNTVTNSTGNGAYVLEGSTVTLTNNTFSNAKMNGILYAGATGSVTGNAITKTTNNGISAKEKSTISSIAGNIISDTTENGILVSDSTVTSATSNTITSPKSNGFSIKEGGSVESVSGNTITTPKSHGLSIKDSSAADVSGNTIENATANGIFVTNSTLTSATSNTITSPKSNGFSIQGNATVTNLNSNTITTPSGNAIYIDGAKVGNAKSNQITSPVQNGFSIKNGSTVTTLSSNKISKPTGNGIYVIGSTIKTLKSNKISSPKGNGMSIRESSAVTTLSKNKVTSSSANGIYITDSTVASAKSNTISSSKKNGFSIASSTVTFDSNEVTACSEQGFFISAGSTATITGNSIHDNLKCGIMFKGSTGTVTGNTFSNNTKYDLYAAEGSKNIVFKDNTSNKASTSQAKADATSSIKMTTALTASQFKIASSKAYTGKQIKPAITTSLTKNTDYTVSYGTNISTGVGTVKIKGKGNYTGTITLKFNIVPKKATLSGVTAGKKQFSAKWKKDAQGTGYQLSYSTSSKFTSSTTVTSTITSNKTVSKVVKSLKANKKYYVRIRTYKTISGKKCYGAWSAVKTVTTKK